MMMKRIIFLINFLIIGLTLNAQDFSDFEKTPMKRWSWIVDADYCMADIKAANLTGLFGINFAGGHLFYGGGFSGTYAYRKEDSYYWTSKRWINNQVVEKQEKDINKAKVSLGVLYVSMDLRYQMMVGKIFSPYLQMRLEKSLTHSSDNFFSHSLGICYNNKKGSSLNFGLGYGFYGYVTGIDKQNSTSSDLIDSGTQFVLSFGYKF